MTAWHAHPDVWSLIAVLGGGYLAALRWLGPRHTGPGDVTATRGQKTAFGLGLLTLWVAADWPVHEIAEQSLYSVHMVQHLLMSLVAPPLLLVGTPAWLARWLLRPRVTFVAVRWLARPLVALAVFNGVVLFTHWPAVVNLTVRHELSHLWLHVALVGSALLMWTPVFSPLMELPRLSYPVQMLYLFGQSILPTIPASFLTFAHSPLYRAYVPFARPWGMSALTDQTIAGLIMKIVGGLILWAVIAYVFFKWHAQEERDGSDALQWRDLERELGRAGTRR